MKNKQTGNWFGSAWFYNLTSDCCWHTLKMAIDDVLNVLRSKHTPKTNTVAQFANVFRRCFSHLLWVCCSLFSFFFFCWLWNLIFDFMHIQNVICILVGTTQKNLQTPKIRWLIIICQVTKTQKKNITRKLTVWRKSCLSISTRKSIEINEEMLFGRILKHFTEWVYDWIGKVRKNDIFGGQWHWELNKP